MGIPAWLISGLARASDVILPPLCLSCRAPVDGHDRLCTQCWCGIDFIRPPLCDRLGIPLPFATHERTLSAAALARPPHYRRARAAARYDGVMRTLIHALKYHDCHETLVLFGRLLAGAGCELLAGAELIVPVPLYGWRQWRRRFNQSALLARRLALETGIAVEPQALRRVRRTASQVGLSREQRRRNVVGAFRVPDALRPRLAGLRIVLVDDVITTGATVDACAAELKSAGAGSVDVVALALVSNPVSHKF